MAIRIVKTLLVLFVGLMALIYALQNIVNLEQARGAVGYVLSMAEHEAYPGHLGPPMTSSIVVMLALTTIVVAELACGFVSLWGAAKLWSARHLPQTFNDNKTVALVGCGIGMLLWFGVWGALGGAWFQMWQTQAGNMSLTHALLFGIVIGTVMVFVNQPD